jgi:hypothetical protein
VGKKKLSRVPVSGGEICFKCRSIHMQRFNHVAEFKPRDTQPYYYKWWDICPRCKFSVYSEQAKVDRPPTGWNLVLWTEDEEIPI